MLPLYPAQQLLVGIAADLSVSLPGADGEPVAGLTVTVDVARANGTVLYTAAAATDAGSGEYTKALTAGDLAQLDYLIATWKVGGVARATTHHEVAGGYYFSVAAARAYDATIVDATKYPDALVRGERGTVEAVFEKICGVAFRPRYRRMALDGSNLRTLLLPDPMVRGGTVRSVTFMYTSTSSYTLSAGELLALAVNYDGILGYLNSQDVVQGIHTAGRFPAGFQNIMVEYEHGFDQPPPDVLEAAFTYLRDLLTRPSRGIPDRAISFQLSNGGAFRLSMPDAFSTGNPDIDAVLSRHAWDSGGSIAFA